MRYFTWAVVDVFSDQHTKALDCAIVEFSSPELLDAAGQTACNRGSTKGYDHNLGRDPRRVPVRAVPLEGSKRPRVYAVRPAGPCSRSGNVSGGLTACPQNNPRFAASDGVPPEVMIVGIRGASAIGGLAGSYRRSDWLRPEVPVRRIRRPRDLALSCVDQKPTTSWRQRLEDLSADDHERFMALQKHLETEFLKTFRKGREDRARVWSAIGGQIGCARQPDRLSPWTPKNADSEARSDRPSRSTAKGSSEVGLSTREEGGSTEHGCGLRVYY
nr:unnamed protein product [Digitaria exilis]